MTRELNLPCPYSVIFDSESSIYTFTTKHNIEYKIAFTNSNFFENGNVFSIVIECVTMDRPQIDDGVRLTIDSIISHFFSDKSRSLLYICETKDRRQLSRKVKFDRWFSYSSVKNQFERYDCVIPTEHESQHTTLIVNKENPSKSDVIYTYKETVSELQDKSD